MLTEKQNESIDRAARYFSEKGEKTGTLRPEFRARILRFLALTRSAMYPTVYGGEEGVDRAGSLRAAARELSFLLCETVEDPVRHDAILRDFFDALPDVYDTLATDIRAAYEGDPAAKSEEEILLAYPAFEAISIYRLAHILYTLEVPLIPRMMTEYAHKNTGVDIHPGATIGHSFFIDHATGVVVGETCRIGNHVKLYQGVTLGAKSFELDDQGNPVKGVKRHPDIGNHVVIYAGATILGGSTVIGDHCVIGGNVWLTHSVPAGETVYYHGGQ